MSDSAPPRITIRYLYQLTADLPATRGFYSDVLGMAEANFSDTPEWGWAVYQCDGLQLMFFRDSESALAFHEAWDFQPGDGDERHTGTRMSFSVHYPWDDFRAVVGRVAAADGVARMSERPTWRQQSYWGWTVKDPGGTTIELYCDPPEQPADPELPQRWTD